MTKTAQSEMAVGIFYYSHEKFVENFQVVAPSNCFISNCSAAVIGAGASGFARPYARFCKRLGASAHGT